MTRRRTSRGRSRSARLRANALLLPNSNLFDWYIGYGQANLDEAVKYLNSQMIVAAIRSMSRAAGCLYAASALMKEDESSLDVDREMRMNPAEMWSRDPYKDANLRSLVHRYRNVREILEETLRRLGVP